VYGSCAVDRSTVGRWVQRVRASGSGETEIRAVRTWLHEQETSWHREGMLALVSHWRKAVDVDGECVKK
jgi:transposase